MTTLFDYALMAGASYISTRDEINQFPSPASWNKTKYENPPDGSGFEAVSFINGTSIAASTEIVISYAGTGTLIDWVANVGLASGAGSDQLRQAAEYYLQLKELNANATISFTGHSLGGGLASLMAVFFGEGATTFDQAPFLRSALTFQTDSFGNPIVNSVAMDLRNYLAGKGYGVDRLTKLDAFIAASDPLNPNPLAGDTLVARGQGVTNINVAGEALTDWPVIPSSNRIGSQANIVNSHDGVGGIDLHSQALLTAFLQSDPTAATNTDANAKTLNRVTFKLLDLMKMLFDKNLFAFDVGTANTSRENFLERIVRHQAGIGTTLPADETRTPGKGTGTANPRLPDRIGQSQYPPVGKEACPN